MRPLTLTLALLSAASAHASLVTFIPAPSPVLASTTSAAAPEVTPIPQQREVYGKVTWMARHAQILERHQTVKPALVFIGDSITHFWSGEPASYRPTDAGSWRKATGGRTATNLGYGFDYIENALWRVQNGELDGIAPQVIVINLGTNNLGHKGDTPAGCERAIQALLAAVRAKQPAAKILLLGLYPRREAKLAEAIAETNRRYAALAGDTVSFLNLGDALAEADKPSVPAKMLFRDGIHPNAAGYAVIAEKLAPVLDALAGSTHPAQASTSPASRESTAWWAQRNQALAAAAKGGVGKARVTFVGDSITQGWEAAGKARWTRLVTQYNAVNLGISGDRTENVLWRLTTGDNLAGNTLKPKAFVVLIGTNNAGHRTKTETPEDIRDGVQAIVDTLRQASPDSKIILMAIFPRTGPADAINRQANPLLQAIADGRTVLWLDIGDKLAPGGRLDPLIMPDKLHLSPKGYEIWSDALAPILAKVAK